MKRRAIVVALLAFGFASSYLGAQGQKVVVIRAGQMFDGKSDGLVSNQMILVQGDRIAEVGPAGSVKVPAGAEEIDLGTGTVLPGLIDGHNHLFKVSDHPGPLSRAYTTVLAIANAKLDLESGFTTARDMSSGGTDGADVAIRNAINEGLIPGQRMQVSVSGMRGSIAGPPYFVLVDSPWEGRKEVRRQLSIGADFIKIMASTISGEGWRNPMNTLEEQQAWVDEAHRQGVKVACTPHAGVAVLQSIEAGCDSLENVTDASPEAIRRAVEKGVYMQFAGFGQKTLRFSDSTTPKGNFPTDAILKATFQRALKAGVKIFFAVNAGGARGGRSGPGPYHGEEAVRFKDMVEYGMTPLQAIRAATSVGAQNMGWQDRVGSIEKGKYADFVGVSGNPAKDVTELERVKFVMKGGQIVRDSLSLKSRAPTTASAGRN